MKIGWMVIALPLLLFISSFLNSSGDDAGVVFREEYIADHFDYPVGKPDAEGYYNAQGFGENNHLGDDWNASTGGNSDLGHPFYATANGYVSFAQDIKGGWGNVIRILHQLPDGTQVESLYAHADTLLVKKGDWVKCGQQVGTIGTAHGLYWAHLHFEIRTDTKMGIGGGYSSVTSGYVDPTAFIRAHRGE
jgi:murein DD-endopeptidase MepM/ murein hydrolase activator NlpD